MRGRRGKCWVQLTIELNFASKLWTVQLTQHYTKTWFIAGLLYRNRLYFQLLTVSVELCYNGMLVLIIYKFLMSKLKIKSKCLLKVMFRIDLSY